VWIRQCCTLYNAALEQRIRAWKTRGMTLRYNDQTRGLTDLREEIEWGNTPVTVLRTALQRLDRSYKAFFRRLKHGGKPGFPRFRSIRRYDSFGIGRVSITQAPNGSGSAYVRVPKIGLVRFKQHRPIEGEIRDVSISVDGRGRWFVQISCDLGDAPQKKMIDAERTTGIDLGLTTFVVLADASEIGSPRFYKRGQESLGRAQRLLSAKKRGSRSRNRARKAVARCHERVRNQRLDFHRKTALGLVRRFDLIAHEDLNVKGLAGSMLAKAVNDAGWAQFISILHCKAEEAGVHVVAVDPRGTSQICSWCGAHVPKALAERVHRCPGCGVVAGRDHNSAREVHARGLRAVPPEFFSAARASSVS
jgi:putative transposase